MSLTTEYQKQFSWRDWNTALSLCPITPGQRVLDLGCSIGDVSRELASRGTIVTGVDSNLDLLTIARSAKISGCEFIQQDLGTLAFEKESFDGLWCSFTAAYFSDFEKVLGNWMSFLKKDAWVCIVEMDNLLGHEPLKPETKLRIADFYRDALSAGKYDFMAGSKAAEILKRAGFKVTQAWLKDRELSFNGPAEDDVLQAWVNRLDRMSGLQKYLQSDFPSFRKEFLNCLSSQTHQSQCRVLCCVGSEQTNKLS